MTTKKKATPKETGGRRPVREAKADSPIRHIQIKIPVASYEDAKRIAGANGLALAAYVRQALLKQIRADSEETGPK